MNSDSVPFFVAYFYWVRNGLTFDPHEGWAKVTEWWETIIQMADVERGIVRYLQSDAATAARHKYNTDNSC